MKKFYQNIFILILLLSSHILAQQFSAGSPEWLVDTYFSSSSFPDKPNYFAGEMLNEVNEQTIGEELNGKGEVSFRQIKPLDKEVAFAVEVKIENNTIDFYCFLIDDGSGWKINAVRRFLLPSFIYFVRDSLAGRTSLSEADSALLRTINLFVMNDSQMKKFLADNLEYFNELILNFNKGENSSVEKLLKNIGCSAVFKDNNFPSCVFIQISSLNKMEAGYIYASEASEIPSVSSDEFVYIEKVMPRWFIYRVM